MLHIDRGESGAIPAFDLQPTKRAGLNRYELLRNDEPFPGLDLLTRGDSGGPVFVHGAIAAVSTFGARLDDRPDEAWGSFGFDVPVIAFREFIRTATNDTAQFIFPGDFNADRLLSSLDMMRFGPRIGLDHLMLSAMSAGGSGPHC